jgi:hypothetical protein
MEREAEIRERAEKATPGPWNGEAGEVWRRDDGPFLQWISTEDGWEKPYEEERRWADSEFIGGAREDVPWLLSRLNTERTARQAAETERDRLRHGLEVLGFDPDEVLGTLFPEGKGAGDA